MNGMIKIKERPEKPEKRPLFKESICSFLKHVKYRLSYSQELLRYSEYSFVYMTYLLMQLFMESGYQLCGAEFVS